MSKYEGTTSTLQGLASSALSNADTYAQSIRNMAANEAASRPSLREPKASFEVSTPDIGEAPKLSDVLLADDNGAEALLQLNQITDDWIDRYFPALDQCLKTMPEDFLCSVFTKPLALDQSVFDDAFNRSRDRLAIVMRSERAQTASLFSQAGFSMPQGAHIAADLRSIQRASDASAELAREQAIQDATIRLENLKWAAGLALDYKRGIMATLAGFLQIYSGLPNDAFERARIKAQAQATLINGLQSYWGIQTSFEELKLKAASLSVETDISVDRNRIARAQSDQATGKAAALAQAVRAFADTAGSAAQAAGTLVAQIEAI